MKNTGIILIIAAVLSVMLCVHWAEARGNHRFNLDQKWKQVQAEEERQERQWKRIECEAEGVQGNTGGAKGTIQPSGGRQRQSP
jgi:hypothetical protein